MKNQFTYKHTCSTIYDTLQHIQLLSWIFVWFVHQTQKASSGFLLQSNHCKEKTQTKRTKRPTNKIQCPNSITFNILRQVLPVAWEVLQIANHSARHEYFLAHIIRLIFIRIYYMSWFSLNKPFPKEICDWCWH